MKSKFKIGDKVRVINYGHPMWTTLEGYYSLAKLDADFKSELLYGVEGLVEIKEPTILSDKNGFLTIDSMPSLVGQEGVIMGSYYDQYPQYCNKDNIEDHKHEYAVEGISQKQSWYNEDQLELI